MRAAVVIHPHQHDLVQHERDRRSRLDACMADHSSLAELRRLSVERTGVGDEGPRRLAEVFQRRLDSEKRIEDAHRRREAADAT